ncbi:hypothetical protein ACCO45_012641 [Purpureocillium lilacinum]|uniref:2EXR domain-containing protein n=2 Tax=Purpureocillium lilacinum TaxID=33203 RepID=A0ABR0BGF9_PURLI|nr:hypothetical protein Purlil1_12608 [Purpureocillium lilacinum]
MATFHPFGRLPSELRARIWASTVESRTVEIRYSPETGDLHVNSTTPVPAVQQTSHEARMQGLYQRAFAYGEEPRYVWVNFDVDVISIGTTYFRYLEPERLLIRRLKFEREDDESFFHFEARVLETFYNVEEVQVICEDGLLSWQEAWESVAWPCQKDKIKFIDKETKQEADGWELDKMWEDILGPQPDKSEAGGGV